jgi:hypothetical protein
MIADSKRILIPHTMKSAIGIDLLFMNCVDDLASKELWFPLRVQLAKRRNKPLCSSDVFRISFFVF